MYLAQEVVNNSFIDLNPIVDDKTSGANSKASCEALLQPFHRKRKHGATGSLEQQHDRIGLEADASKNCPTTLISLKIAALEALEALLTVVCLLNTCLWSFFVCLNSPLVLLCFCSDLSRVMADRQRHRIELKWIELLLTCLLLVGTMPTLTQPILNVAFNIMCISVFCFY